MSKPKSGPAAVAVASASTIADAQQSTDASTAEFAPGADPQPGEILGDGPGADVKPIELDAAAQEDADRRAEAYRAELKAAADQAAERAAAAQADAEAAAQEANRAAAELAAAEESAALAALPNYVEARVLAECAFGKPNDIALIPRDLVKEAVEASHIDIHPAAVQFAKDLAASNSEA